jgi:hypothetical protein
MRSWIRFLSRTYDSLLFPPWSIRFLNQDQEWYTESIFTAALYYRPSIQLSRGRHRHEATGLHILLVTVSPTLKLQYLLPRAIITTNCWILTTPVFNLPQFYISPILFSFNSTSFFYSSYLRSTKMIYFSRNTWKMMYRHDRPAVFTHKLPGKNNSEDLDVDGSI